MTNKLPLNWCECKFGDICYLQNGYAFNSKEYSDSGINLIRISDIKDDKVITDNCVKVCDNVDISFRVNKGDFLLAMSGATTGKTGVYLYDNYALLNQRVGNLKIYSEDVLHPMYRNYFIMNKRREIEKKAYGGAQPNISKQLIEDLDLLLPPLAEQKRIVGKIEQMFEKIDAGVQKLKSAQEKIKQYKQSVLHSAFTGKLYKTTEWQQTKLSEISNVLGGYAFKSNLFTTDGYQIIRMSNIKPLELNLKERPVFIKNIDNKLKQQYMLMPNDIVITLTGTRKKRDYGYVVLIETNSGLLLNQRLARLRPNFKVKPKYLAYALQSEPYQSQFFSYETGNVGQGNVSMKALIEEAIYLPTIPEQERIVEEIEKRFAKADKMLEGVEKSLKSAEQLKQSVLKKAFEGKLVPQDPNDEPASVLLARIKSEKQQNEKVKGKRNDRK